MKGSPIQIIDGRWYAFGWGGEPRIEVCCSCSHSHRIRYKIQGGRLWIQYQTLKGLTRALRRKEGIKLTRQPQKKSNNG